MEKLGSLKSIIVSFPFPDIALVTLNRPKSLNAISKDLSLELKQAFDTLSKDSEIRSIVLTGGERSFSSGIEISELQMPEGTDGGRTAIKLQDHLRSLQQEVSSIEECRKPVIAVVSGYCIGYGIDIITACCIRICSNSTKFSVREARVGLAADVGTLQRLPKVTGNMSWVRDICYTARDFGPDEALRFGLVSQIHQDYQTALKAGLDLAQKIAANSPLAVIGTKANIKYSIDHTVAESLDYMEKWNSWALQTKDMETSVLAIIEKKKPVYPKL